MLIENLSEQQAKIIDIAIDNIELSLLENLTYKTLLYPLNTKRALLECKVQIDRWDSITDILLFNPDDAHYLEDMYVSHFLPSQKTSIYCYLTKICSEKEMILVNDEIPLHIHNTATKFGNQDNLWGAIICYYNKVPKGKIIGIASKDFEKVHKEYLLSDDPGYLIIRSRYASVIEILNGKNTSTDIA